MSMLVVLALGHYLQGEAWLDWVERLVVEHDFAMVCSLLSCFAMRGFLDYVQH